MSMRWQTAGVCALAACAAFCGRANPVKPYAEALKDGKDMMILCVGSDWMPDADRYIAAFRTAAQGFSGEVTWALYDRRAGLGDEQAKALGKLPCEVYGYPCLIYRDSEGRPLFQQEAIRLEALQKLAPLATRTLKIRNDRDIALKAARAMAKGPAKAEALGKALAPILDPVLGSYSERAVGAYQDSVRSVVKEIREADPADTDGWAAKYSFCYLPLAESFGKHDAVENLDAVSVLLTKKALLPVQRQQLYSLRFSLLLGQTEEDEKIDGALAALKEGIAVDPTSPMAASMRNVMAYYTNPVRLSGMRWLGKDNRPRWQKAILDCSGVVKVGGTYRVSFRPRAGGTRFRKVAFAGGAVGEERGGDWICRFPGEGKAVLEMEIKGSGWFDGNGDIVVTRE